jgi:hypothetical protein
MDRQTEYIESLSAEVVAWDLQIDRLRDQALSAAPGDESAIAAEVTALQLKRDAAALELQGLSPVSDGQWKDITAGSEDTMDEVRTMLSDAITKIS